MVNVVEVEYSHPNNSTTGERRREKRSKGRKEGRRRGERDRIDYMMIRLHIIE